MIKYRHPFAEFVAATGRSGIHGSTLSACCLLTLTRTLPPVIINDAEALQLADNRDTAGLAAQAREIRDRRHAGLVTYSRKVFIPLTHLCRMSATIAPSPPCRAR